MTHKDDLKEYKAFDKEICEEVDVDVFTIYKHEKFTNDFKMPDGFPAGSDLIRNEFRKIYIKQDELKIQIKSLVENLGGYVDKLREMDERINRMEAESNKGNTK